MSLHSDNLTLLSTLLSQMNLDTFFFPSLSLTVVYCFKIINCGFRFNENIVIDPGSVDIFPSSRIPKNLHHLVKPIYRSTSVTSKESLRTCNTTKEKGFQITTDPHTLSSILQCTPDDEVTFHFYLFLDQNVAFIKFFE